MINPFLILLIAMLVSSIFVIRSDFNVAIRAVGIIALIFSSVIAFLLLDSYIGKPRQIELMPEEVVVYGQIIKDKTISILYLEKGKDPPAEYITMPYNKSLHKALSEGARKSKGKPFILKSTTKRKGSGERGEGGEGKQGKGKGGKSGKKGDSGEGKSNSLFSQTFESHDLPPPIMPAKEE